MTTEQLTDVTLHNGLWHYTQAEELLAISRQQLRFMLEAINEPDDENAELDPIASATDLRAVQLAGVIVELHTAVAKAHGELAGVHAAVANVRNSGALPDLPGSWSGLPR